MNSSQRRRSHSYKGYTNSWRPCQLCKKFCEPEMWTPAASRTTIPTTRAAQMKNARKATPRRSRFARRQMQIKAFQLGACASEKRAASARAGLTPMILKFTPWMSGFVSDGSGPARIAPRVGEVSAARRLRRAERGEGGGARDQCCTQRFQMVTGLRIIRCFWFAFVARCCCGGLFAWAAGSNAVTFCETCDDD